MGHISSFYESHARPILQFFCFRLEAMKAQATILMMETDQQEDYVPPVTTKSQDPVLSELEDEDEDEDEDISPPLEFSVTDSSSETEKISEEVVFASEAVEDADSALRDRKRKSDARQVIPRSKSQRVGSDRCVPTSKC